jgi:hypothetical protein
LKRRARGHTLAELMLASMISMMLLFMIGVMVSGYSRNYRLVSQHGITLQALVVGLDRIRLEALEARTIELPGDSRSSSVLSFHRLQPGQAIISNDNRDQVEVEYSVHPDGGLWRKFVNVDGKETLSPLAFDIVRLVCTRKGPILDIQLVPREGPPMTARLCVGRSQ